MQSDGRIVIETDLDTKSFDAQIVSLENKLDTLEQEYEVLKKTKPYEGQREDLIYYEKEIEKTTNQIIGLRKQQVKTEETTSKGWNKALKNLKNVGLRMLGIASIYGIISKASSAYLSQDIELAEKLQSVWVALGSFIAPAIEGISDILLKAVGYINEFVKALTGIDYIANANARALQKQAKATKELNKQTYDFDVVRTQQESSSSSVSSSGGLINIPELDDRIVQKLKNLATWLKENEDLVKAVGIALGVTFGAVAIGKLLGNIAMLIGSEAALTGLAGLGYLLLGLASAVIITIAIKGIVEAIEQAKELNQVLREEKDIVDSNKSSLDKLYESFWNLENGVGATDEQVNLFTKTLFESTEQAKRHIQEMEKDKNLVGAFTGANKKLTESQIAELEIIQKNNEQYKKLYEQGKLNDTQKRAYKESLDAEIKATQLLGGEVENLKKEYAKIDGKVYTQTIKVDADTSQAERKASLLDSLFRGIGTSINSAWGGLKSAFSGVKFAAGGIVTQPTRAIIGEAGYPEAVVPMTDDYLSTLAQLIGQYGGGSGGETTNVYLDGRLIQRQMANRENEIRFSTNK